MNAQQIAHIVSVLVESYSRGELTPEEFAGLSRALTDEAQARGIGEEYLKAYRELTWRKHQARLHNYEAPANG
jgi:hypothetical protein